MCAGCNHLSGASAGNELPQYRRDDNYANQEGYQELFNLILTQWFNSAGFFQPTLTAAQVTQLTTLPAFLPNGTHWLNATLNKMQFVDATGAIQTVTSA